MADDPTPVLDPAPDPKPDPVPDPKPDPAPESEDWKGHARKHERRAKQEAARAAELEARLAELENASKSEQEKALEQARKEAADAVKAEVTSTFRQKILKAEIRAQAAGKFHDPDDAIRLLDLEDSDVFDDEGEVQTDALTAALDALLERKPHLRAGSTPPPVGDPDAGKGNGAGKSLSDLSVEDHLARIQKPRR